MRGARRDPPGGQRAASGHRVGRHRAQDDRTQEDRTPDDRTPDVRGRDSQVGAGTGSTDRPLTGAPVRLRSRSVVIAGLCLAGLGVLAHLESGGQSTVSGTASAASPGPAGNGLSSTPPGPAPSNGPSPSNVPQVLRRLVVAPRSVCHRFVETSGGAPAQMISVQNSCQ